jgi:hypothetical protein
MGVADGISELRLLAADIANLCHGLLQMSSDVGVQTIDFIGAEVVSTTPAVNPIRRFSATFAFFAVKSFSPERTQRSREVRQKT